MSYCPNCFKVHTYIDELCSVCGTKLKRMFNKPFLRPAIEKVMANLLDPNKKVVLVMSRHVGRALVRRLLGQYRWIIRARKYMVIRNESG